MSRLPLPAPADPLPLARQWLDEAAAGGTRNPAAMALATADETGRPSVRMVLLKGFSVSDGYAVFFTHYESRKARELASRPRAAAVLYWEELGRQIRFEGPIVRSPSAESDAYFATRPWRARLNAWASRQSQPLTDPKDLERRADERALELGRRGAAGRGDSTLPRPPFWGGYRIWFDTLELWVEGADRFHERVRYTRSLSPADELAFRAGAWSSERLQP